MAIASFYRQKKPKDSIWFRPALAREVLQGDCLFPEEIENLVGIEYPKDEQERLLDGLPPKKILEAYRQNNVLLVAGPPESMTFNQLQEKHLVEGINSPSYFSGETSEVHPGWLALRKDLLLGSVEKDWLQIKKVIPQGEKPASVTEVAWALSVYWKLRKKDFLSDSLTYTEESIEVGNLSFHLSIGLSCSGCPLITPWRDVGQYFWAVGLLTKIVNSTFITEAEERISYA